MSETICKLQLMDRSLCFVTAFQKPIPCWLCGHRRSHGSHFHRRWMMYIEVCKKGASRRARLARRSWIDGFGPVGPVGQVGQVDPFPTVSGIHRHDPGEGDDDVRRVSTCLKMRIFHANCQRPRRFGKSQSCSRLFHSFCNQNDRVSGAGDGISANAE